MIAQNNLYAAIFAPGWVFENNDKSLFFDNQDKLVICCHDDDMYMLYRFWTLLSPYCPTYPLSNLPLLSSFGRGKGTSVSINGKVINWLLHNVDLIYCIGCLSGGVVKLISTRYST